MELSTTLYNILLHVGKIHYTVMNKENKTVSQWELTSLGSALVTHPLTADSSIFHNHCNRCEAFGRCVGDKTEGHCNQCGKHYSELGYSSDVKFKCGGRGR